MKTSKLIKDHTIRAFVDKKIDEVLRREPHARDRELLLHIADSLLGEAKGFTPPRCTEAIHEAQLILDDALTHLENNH